MNQEENQGEATVVDTTTDDAVTAAHDTPVQEPAADTATDPIVTVLEPSEAAKTSETATLVVNDDLREQFREQGQAIRAAAGLPPIDGQVTLRSEIYRLEHARALREVSEDSISGMPYIEPGSIERFADTDGRTMAIVVSLGELCKSEVKEA